jgi:hypothetical protein
MCDFKFDEKELDHIIFGLNHLWLVYMSSDDKRLQKMCYEIDKLLEKLNAT